MSTEDGSATPRRRNGRLQACEPCRKRKIACDHTLPICKRCQVRKVASSCVYVEAPMTQRGPTAVHGDGDATPDGNNPLPVLNAARQKALRYHHDSGRISKKPKPATPLFSGPAAFLGPTSFSAVLLEHRNRLEPHKNPPLRMPASAHWLGSDSDSSGDVGETNDGGTLPSNDLIDLGVTVLKSIPCEGSCKLLFSRHVSQHEGWSRLAADQIQTSLWATFGRHLSRRSCNDLKTLSELICQNGTKVVREEGDRDKYISSFTNGNLRWEALGLLFTYWSFGAANSQDDDPIFQANHGKKDREQFMLEMKECALSCIALCSYYDCGNSLIVYLLYKHCLLEAIVSGDSSLVFWRQHGDLCSVTTSLGLHRDGEAAPTNSISVATELRRRIYAAVFSLDKVNATFSGRPPLLSHRYTSTPFPLDISDPDLLGDEATQTKAFASLDSEGWNKNGMIYSTTILRTRAMLSYIRDEILEMALGTVSVDFVTRATSLKERSLATYNGFPAVIQYNEVDINIPEVSGHILYARIMSRLDHLQNLFLLDRLLIKHGCANSQSLANISLEMVDLINVFWKQRERFQGIRRDFQWMIMYYAVPGAGALCVELLRMSKSSRPSTERVWLPRSQVIQSLSMLATFLDWINPTAPNSDLCARVSRIISRVLDEVLDNSANDTSSDQPTNISVEGSTEPLFPSLDWSTLDDWGRNDLLDTFDWL